MSHVVWNHLNHPEKLTLIGGDLYIGRTTNGCILLIIVFPSNPSQVIRLCHLLDGIFVVLEIRNKKQTDLTGQCNPAGSCYPFLSLTIGDKIVVKND